MRHRRLASATPPQFVRLDSPTLITAQEHGGLPPASPRMSWPILPRRRAAVNSRDHPNQEPVTNWQDIAPPAPDEFKPQDITEQGDMPALRIRREPGAEGGAGVAEGEGRQPVAQTGMPADDEFFPISPRPAFVSTSAVDFAETPRYRRFITFRGTIDAALICSRCAIGRACSGGLR